MKNIPRTTGNTEVDFWRLRVERNLNSLGNSVVTLSSYDPQDGTSIYGGMVSVVPGTIETSENLNVFANSTLKRAFITWDTEGAAGSADTITVTFKLNGSASTTLATLSRTDVTRQYVDTALSVAVVVGDYFQILVNCPSWPTNPATVSVDWVVYLE